LDDTARVRHLPYLAVINLSNGKIIRLEQDSDYFDGRPLLNDGGNDNYVLTTSGVYVKNEFMPETSVNLVDTKTGFRKNIFQSMRQGSEYFFSPNGRYVLTYNKQKNAYFTYDMANSHINNVTKAIRVPLYHQDWGEAKPSAPYGFIGWLKDDKGILIYDRYDIWLVDPLGKRLPINITNGYGRKNKIHLRCVFSDNVKNKYGIAVIEKDMPIIISGLSDATKHNSFYKIDLSKPGSFYHLGKFSDLIYFADHSSVGNSQFIEKAKDSNVYLLMRQSASEYPNVSLTNDFKTFRAVSHFHPQDRYNWLTSELLTWKTFNGKQAQGILYKPENFESHKKYPVILCFYEQLSDGLNKFLMPELSRGPMNIPLFVSHGYLVFCPDIHYKVGRAGASAYDYVVSAAKMLMKMQSVDIQRMGIQGHSWGGFEVNYLITRTKMFAAAASSSGLSDWISDYGSIGWGHEIENYIEEGQPRLGQQLWQAKGSYITNSPVLYANKVTTPLLIMDNKNDEVVPPTQGVEFFLALRRLQKRTWMLRYDDGRHVLPVGPSQLDYSIRLGQFFDHYLKDKPAPRWMVEGVPANMKQIDKGLELEPGRVP
jgi:dipeptidyl aminopeptidase/acylaminoacyl peptidase